MTTEEKLLRLVVRLYTKTKAGEVQWERTFEPTVFQTAFPNYIVKLSTVENELDLDADMDYMISIVDESGHVLESTTHDQLRRPFREQPSLVASIGPPSAAALLAELYTTARRQALGVDSALDTLLGELD